MPCRLSYAADSFKNQARKAPQAILSVSVMDAYRAGECFPLFWPSGWRRQEQAVIELIVENCCPQYLQVYRDFSLPS